MGFAAYLVRWAVRTFGADPAEGAVAIAAFCLMAASAAIAGATALFALKRSPSGSAPAAATAKAVAVNTILAVGVAVAAVVATAFLAIGPHRDLVGWMWLGAVNIVAPATANALLLRDQARRAH